METFARLYDLIWRQLNFTAALHLEHIIPGKGVIMYVGSMVDPSVPAPSKNETDIVATMDANDQFTNVYRTNALVLCLVCPTR
jgi:hypothetical protein